MIDGNKIMGDSYRTMTKDNMNRQYGREQELRIRRRRERAKRILIRRIVKGLIFLAVIILFAYLGVKLLGNNNKENADGVTSEYISESSKKILSSSDIVIPDWIIQDFLEPNEYSRPQTELTSVTGVVIHYVGNPGTTAENNVHYFNSLAETGDTYASSHFVIGIDGEIIQCIPLTEIAYASNERNYDTISIECCHSDSTGEFSSATYQSLVKLTKWLMETYGLNTGDILRHYDVTGKLCPLYYVEDPDAWESFKKDLQ